MFNSNSKGYSVGSVALVVFLLGTIAATFANFNTRNYGSYAGLRESSAPVEAAVLLHQAAQMQAATGSLLRNYTDTSSIAAAKIGSRSGVLTLDIQGTLYSEDFRIPQPSAQLELKSREWLISSISTTVYALLPFNSVTLCIEINRATGSNYSPLNPNLGTKSTWGASTFIDYPALTSSTTSAGVKSTVYTSTHQPAQIPLEVGNRNSFCVCWNAPTRCIFYAELARL